MGGEAGRMRAVALVRRVATCALAALAAATLTHALLVCVRRQRRQLAVYKSLGFTRRQVVGAIGIPLGLVLARWGWRVLARGLGIAGEVSIPMWMVVVVANLAAAIPAWRAGRIPAAEALRTE